MEHELKTWPMFFEKTLSGEKKFEVRRNDRDFNVGDTLMLREYDGKYNEETKAIEGEYTGRKMYVNVNYILSGYNWGIRHEFIVMSIAPRDMSN